MSLARAEGPFQSGEAGTSHVGAAAMVIAIALTPEERLRVAQFSGRASVVLVSTREEALALLLGDAPPTPSAPPPEEPEGATAAPATVTVDSDVRTANWGGRATALSPLEHDLLCCLLEEIGRTWSFDVLHLRVWGNDHLGDRSDVQSVVKRLRRKLSDLDCPLQIMAVRGVGLRLVDGRHAPEVALLGRPNPR